MFNPNIPIVHSISSTALKEMGFIKDESIMNRQSIIAVYKKGEDVITYNGVHWVYNGKVVQFLEDMKNTNTPDKQG